MLRLVNGRREKIVALAHLLEALLQYLKNQDGNHESSTCRCLLNAHHVLGYRQTSGQVLQALIGATGEMII